MTILNIVLLTINFIFLVYLVRKVAALVNKDFAKFNGISSTINYWSGELSHGDKFVIFPKKSKVANGDATSFMQFKVHESEGKKFSDLVYPLNSNETNGASKEDQLNSLANFFNLSSEAYIDEENSLKFYFSEIDVSIDNHVLFLVSLGKLQLEMSLETPIGINIIRKENDLIEGRFRP